MSFQVLCGWRAVRERLPGPHGGLRVGRGHPQACGCTAFCFHLGRAPGKRRLADPCSSHRAARASCPSLCREEAGPRAPYRGGEAPGNCRLESPGLPPALLPSLSSLIGLESPGREASPVQAGTAPAPRGSGLGACQPGSSASSDAPPPSPKGPGLSPGKKRQRSCCRGTECARERRRGSGAGGCPLLPSLQEQPPSDRSWPPGFTSRVSLALRSCVRCPHLGERSWHPGAWKGEDAAREPCRQSPRAALGG